MQKFVLLGSKKMRIGNEKITTRDAKLHGLKQIHRHMGIIVRATSVDILTFRLPHVDMYFLDWSVWRLGVK